MTDHRIAIVSPAVIVISSVVSLPVTWLAPVNVIDRAVATPFFISVNVAVAPDPRALEISAYKSRIVPSVGTT